ncbi:hypothetical protein EDB89DRAFT_690663 [Lactarius sanguifluus]|nr:hypothetical protein EDB89DRAFT_690663 [Lactarius sanguifluus]
MESFIKEVRQVWTRFTCSRGFQQVPYPSVSTSTSQSQGTTPGFSNTLLPLALPNTQIDAKTRKQEFSFPASPPPRCWPVLHDTDPHHPWYPSQIVSPRFSMSSAFVCAWYRVCPYILSDDNCVLDLASVIGSGPDIQRSTVSLLPTITTPRLLSSFLDNLRAAHPTLSYLLSPPGNMPGPFLEP